MKLSTFEISRIKALHYLLEEAHVGRAAQHLRITPAAASNALRRLREDFGDPLLIRHGRGLVRTRLGNELRGPTREVVEAAKRLLSATRTFDPGTFRGEVLISMSDHVAAVLLPEIDRIARRIAPHATLTVAAIPEDVPAWLERNAGVLVGPVGGFAAAEASDRLLIEPFYEDHYVTALRSGHAFETRAWDAPAYAGIDHILVTPRGRSQFSDIDRRLDELGLSRRIARIVPSFTLALALVADSDLITTLPALYARRVPLSGITLRRTPVDTSPLAMGLLVHPAHAEDAVTRFTKEVLRGALQSITAA